MEKKALTDALRDALGDEEAVQVILQNAQETTAVSAF
jgi:hypothetical protein